MFASSTIESSFGGLLAAGVFHAMTFRYSLPAVVSQVYSTYTMLPSPLMSPYSFNTLPFEPLATPLLGTIPVTNPPSGIRTAPAAWVLVKHAVIVGGVDAALIDATRNDSWLLPSMVVSITYDGLTPDVAHNPAPSRC
jgi:hypothetical protein